MNKSAYKDAGAIYVNKGTLNVDGSEKEVVFRENISNFGASIYGDKDSKININKASFSYSKAEEGKGAAIYTRGELIINNSEFGDMTKKGSIVHIAEGAKKFEINYSKFIGNDGSDVIGIYTEAQNKVSVSLFRIIIYCIVYNIGLY